MIAKPKTIMPARNCLLKDSFAPGAEEITALELPVTRRFADQSGRCLRGRTALLLLALVAGGTAATAARTSDRTPDTEEAFRATMNEAVTRMHAEMHVPYTGDADRDFARMMIPHHQGAIDMALVELRYGKDARLKRLAQEIIVTQQQEITVMHLALGDPLPPGSPAPTQLSPSPEVHQ